MSAEGTPHESVSLLGRLMVWITWLSLRLPYVTVAIGVLAAAGSLYLSHTRLGFRTSRADLLNPKSEFNRRWLEYTKEFGDSEDVVLLVEGASQEKVVPVLEELAAELIRENKLWNTVLHKIDLSKIRSKGLYYLKPEELANIEMFLDKFGQLTRGNWAQMNLGNMAAEMGKMMQFMPSAQTQNPQALAQMAAIEKEILRFFDSLILSLSQQGKYQSPWDDMAKQMGQDQETVHYLLAKDGKMGFIQLRLAGCEKDSFTGNKNAIEALRQIVSQTRSRHADMLVGLTGLPIIEHDEMSSSESSMSIATVLSMAGVLLVVVLGFGGMRHSILPMTALFLGMIWSLGYTVLTVGHLNILSSAFGAILTGLGINYGIYITARYLQLREANKLVEESLLETAGTIVPGIVIGMLATAISFFMAGFTEFVGVAELGIVAGGGIILCCLAAVTVLPALILICDKKNFKALPQPLEFHRFLDPVCDKYRSVLVCGLAGTVVLAVGLGRIWYDHNLLHMQASGLESVMLEQKIISEGDQSASFAISIADNAQSLLERKKQLLQLPSVKHIIEVDSIMDPDGSMSAPMMAAKRQAIERISGRLTNLPQQVPQIPLTSMNELGQMLAGVQARPNGCSPELLKRMQQLGYLMQQLPQAECYARLAHFQQAMATDVLTRLYALRAVSNPEPPQLTDLPESLVKRFVSPSGKHLMKVYSKADIWDMAAMEQFVRELRSVDKNITGNPVQIYEASLQMKRSYEQATWFALFTILPVMVFTMGSLRDSLLAVLPLAVCMLQMFGIMGILNIPLNAANMISLPLMLGMGVDNGINIIFDYRRQHGNYKMSPSTGVAVILNTLTTMVGFAVLMIADHRGLQSLGRVLTIGMSCSLFSSLIMLPAFLVWLTRNRKEEGEEAEEPVKPMVEEEPLAQESATTDIEEDYDRDYRRRLRRGDESRPLSEIWQLSQTDQYAEEESNVEEEEILHFPPATPSYNKREWPQKRSA